MFGKLIKEMKKYTKLNDIEFANAKQSVLRNCIRDKKHFCDGTPNLSEKSRERIEKCKYYVKGRCMINELQTDLRKISRI